MATPTHDAIIEHCVKQMFQANKKCQTCNEKKVGDHVYVSTQNLTLLKGSAQKLIPKYIEPHTIAKAHNEAFTMVIELPLEFASRWISATFHTGVICRFVANNNNLFLKREAMFFYDFGWDDKQEWLIKEIISHTWWSSNELELEIRWMLGDTTWESLVTCKDLEALDTYLELRSVTKPRDLPSEIRSHQSCECHMTLQAWSWRVKKSFGKERLNTNMWYKRHLSPFSDVFVSYYLQSLPQSGGPPHLADVPPRRPVPSRGLSPNRVPPVCLWQSQVQFSAFPLWVQILLGRGHQAGRYAGQWSVQQAVSRRMATQDEDDTGII